jgi:hypothetical protein
VSTRDPTQRFEIRQRNVDGGLFDVADVTRRQAAGARPLRLGVAARPAPSPQIQHFGVPTRLLDWSTNPLVALFMAVADDEANKDASPDGILYAINPKAHLPTDEQPFASILTPDHPYARKAIEVVTTWSESDQTPHILPIRPDTRAGRLERQSACFTFHSYASKSTQNDTLRCCVIPHQFKLTMRTELSRLSINQFVVYNTLDRLSRELKTTWGLQ